jgi:hypothetical protein
MDGPISHFHTGTIGGPMLERYRHGVKDFLGLTLGLKWPSRAFAVDAALAVVAGLVTAGFAIWLHLRLNFDVMCRSYDVWFDSDPARMIGSLQSRWSGEHARSNLHPLWSIGITTPFVVLFKLSILDIRETVTAYVAFCGAIFGGSIFAALRLLQLGRLDSFLLVALCLSTTTSWLWLGFPELFVLGGASVVVPLIWLVVPRGRHDVWSAPLQSVVSLSITITNWTAGLYAALLGLGWRQALQASMVAFTICGVGAFLQYFFFPASGSFFNVWTEKNETYGVTGTLLQHLSAFFLTTIAGPAPELMDVAAKGMHYALDGTGDRASRFQFSPPTNSPMGIATLVLWGILAVRGLVIAARGGVEPKVVFFVVGMIAFNAALHAAYGIETFLYAPHFLPLFIFVVAWSLLSLNGATAVRMSIVAAVIVGMIHNSALFTQVADWHNSIPPDLVIFPFSDVSSHICG